MKVCANCLSAQELSADETYCHFCGLEAVTEIDNPEETYEKIYDNLKWKSDDNN